MDGWLPTRYDEVRTDSGSESVPGRQTEGQVKYRKIVWMLAKSPSLGSLPSLAS